MFQLLGGVLLSYYLAAYYLGNLTFLFPSFHFSPGSSAFAAVDATIEDGTSSVS